ncbi:hypothetical protein [Nitrosospira sp. NpAV]|uniref:hypothetical protein n=1 Tax=Nitrosospira sp. NpAV TaxID=58133 RepID=UPI00059FFF4C|nr:hypothetical protein [Nitrosospira sp. NpAV]KIO48074.1 hypothetical protein SQ11_12780 [Nitrosospira sp. NpAV]
MPDRFAVLITLLVTPLIVGCAQIKSFTVAPSTVCPGETVRVDWLTSGAADNVTLDSVPVLAGAGEVPEEGSRFFTPAQNTRFILKVPGVLKNAQREWDMQVLPNQSSRLLGGIAQCGGEPPSVSASFTIQAKDSSSRVRAVLITNNYPRPLSISKDGMEVAIPPNGATDGFKNMPIIGTWIVRTPVGPDEACDNALTAVARRLTIKTQMTCEE